MEKTWSKSAQWCCAVYQCPLNIGFLIWFSASLSSEQQYFRIYKSKTVARVRQCMWEPFPVIEMITSVFYPPSLFPLTHTYTHTDTLCVPLMFPYVCVLMWAYCNSIFFYPPPTAQVTVPLTTPTVTMTTGITARMTLPDAYVIAMEIVWVCCHGYGAKRHQR